MFLFLCKVDKIKFVSRFDEVKKIVQESFTSNVFRHNALAGARGSNAATKSHTLILPSYAPLTIRFESNRMHLTNSSCPSSTRKQAPHSISHKLQKIFNFSKFYTAKI